MRSTRTKTMAVPKRPKATLPQRDASGKVHGTLPMRKSLSNYTDAELMELKDELKESIRARKEKSVQSGWDRTHTGRIEEELELVRFIEKAIGK